MAKFSELSIRRLEECDERLQRIMWKVIEHVDVSVLCGHRGKAEQDRSFLLGNSMVNWPNSGHNLEPAMAVDVAPWFEEKPHIRWNLNHKDTTIRWYRMVGYIRGVAAVMGIKLKPMIKWDIGHVELV